MDVIFYLASQSQMQKAAHKRNNLDNSTTRNGFGLERTVSIPLQVQQAISKNFIDKIKNEVQNKEFQAIYRSTLLVEQLQHEKSKEEADNFAGSRSYVSTCISDNNWSRRAGEERRLISRKSPKALPSDWQLERCIRDIEQNCSRKTLSIIRSLIQDSKTMKKTLITLESQNKTYQTSINHYQFSQQENHILKKQIEQLHCQLNKIKKEQQQNKIMQNPERSSEKKNGNQLFFTEHSNSLKVFLLAKEKYIQEKEKKAATMMNKIQSVLVLRDIEEGCQKCCSFLKKIKESLLGYRKYLQEQETQVTSLFEECKSILIFE